MTRMQDQPVTGRFDGIDHHYPARVYFEDTDLWGVVYHANCLRFMERARSDMLRLAGIDQRAAFEAGEGAHAVADLHVRFAAPAKLDDDLVVSRLRTVRAAGVVIHQEVRRDGALLTDATVTVALVAPGGRPRRQPAAWTAIYKSLLPQESQCTPSS